MVEQHADHIFEWTAVVFMKVEPACHPQEMVEGDGTTGIERFSPERLREFPREGQPTLANQDPGQGVDDRLGHRPAQQGRIGAEAFCILFGDQAAVMKDDDRPCTATGDPACSANAALMTLWSDG